MWEEVIGTVNLVFAKFKHSEKPYLYAVPKGAVVHKGDMVFAPTKYNELALECITDMIPADKDTMIAMMLSAGIDELKYLTGKAKYVKVEFEVK